MKMTIPAFDNTKKTANVPLKSNLMPQKKSTPKKQISEQNSKKSFAFGSSTPRELSHINKVSRTSRLIDTNGQQNTASNTNNDDSKHNLSYYMRQARSITPSSISMF